MEEAKSQSDQPVETPTDNQTSAEKIPPPSKRKKTPLLVGGIIVVLIGAVGFLVFQNLKIKSQVTQPPSEAELTASPMPEPTNTPAPTATPTPQPEPTAIPTEAEKEANIPSGWVTYTNQEYGFQISYPGNYQALADEENLYGWPKAIVLLYSGGQSYDLPIEAWDSVSEYEDKYKNQIDDLTVKRVGNKYITLLNMNREAEVDQIITTFKILN